MIFSLFTVKKFLFTVTLCAVLLLSTTTSATQGPALSHALHGRQRKMYSAALPSGNDGLGANTGTPEEGRSGHEVLADDERRLNLENIHDVSTIITNNVIKLGVH